MVPISFRSVVVCIAFFAVSACKKDAPPPIEHPKLAPLDVSVQKARLRLGDSTQISFRGGELPYRLEGSEEAIVWGNRFPEAVGVSASKPGTYTVRVYDQVGRTGSATFEVAGPLKLVKVESLSVNPSPKADECQLRPGEHVRIEVTGGFRPYRFDAWSPSAQISATGELVAGSEDDGFNVSVEDDIRDFEAVKLRCSIERRHGFTDPSFGQDGFLAIPGMNRIEAVESLDGKLWVVGSGEEAGRSVTSLVKVADELDQEFGIKGRVVLENPHSLKQSADPEESLPYNETLAVWVGPSAIVRKVRFAGTDSWLEEFAIVRNNRDGSLDKRFGTGGFLRASNVALRWTNVPEDPFRIYEMSRWAGHSILRGYTSHGSTDPAFGKNGVISLPIEGNVFNPIVERGKAAFIVGGYVRPGQGVLLPFYSNDSNCALAKVFADGTFDKAFGTDGVKVFRVPSTGFPLNSSAQSILAMRSDLFSIFVAGISHDQLFTARFHTIDGSNNLFREGGETSEQWVPEESDPERNLFSNRHTYKYGEEADAFTLYPERLYGFAGLRIFGFDNNVSKDLGVWATIQFPRGLNPQITRGVGSFLLLHSAHPDTYKPDYNLMEAMQTQQVRSAADANGLGWQSFDLEHTWPLLQNRNRLVLTTRTGLMAFQVEETRYLRFH